MNRLTDIARVLAARNTIKHVVEKRCFRQQLDFINDPSKRKVLFTPRRSGKSTACALLLFQEAMLYPGRIFLYLGLSKEAAERAIFFDVLEPELTRRNVKFKYNKVDKTITLPNRSKIKISGLDSSQREQKKLLGGKYHLAIIDECQDQIQDLHSIIYKALGPAMSDYALKEGGIIVLAGTPGDVPSRENLWYRLTRRVEPTEYLKPEERAERTEWSLHTWNVTDNPHMVREFEAECARLHSRYAGPSYREDPIFRKEWLGEWITQISRQVYSFEPTRNYVSHHHTRDESPEAADQVSKLQSMLRGDRFWEDGERRRFIWNYLIGCDLGYVDATALVVCCYSLQDENFYVLTSEKRAGATVSEVAAWLITANSMYRPEKILVDAAAGGKQIAESIRREHSLPIFGAQKTEKENHIARMNSDLVTGRIKIIGETNPALIQELQELVLDQKCYERHEWKEAERFDNHLCDATLYAYKEAYHCLSKPPEKPLDTTSYTAQTLARQERALVQRPEDPYDVWNSKQDGNYLANYLSRKANQ